MWYPTAENPVAGTFVREHAKAVALYDEVVVLHLEGVSAGDARLWRMEEERDPDLTQGLPTYRVWHKRSPIPRTSYLLYLWAAFRAFSRLGGAGFHPDVIHAHVYAAGVPAVLIGKTHRIPVVATEHFTGFPRRTLSRRAQWEARLAFAASDVVMPVSRSLKEAIEAYGMRGRFRVVPNAVDTSLFHPSPSASEGDGTRRLLAVTVLDTEDRKGTGGLITALKGLRAVRDDWHLDIVGDGRGKEAYESMANELGLADQITFHGVQSKEVVASLMRRADLLVVPSLVETFSVVAAEALASGIRVVATRCGGPEEFVNEDVGALVPPGDTRALAEALDQTLDGLHDLSAEDISQYATRRFGLEHVGARLHSVYESCVAGAAS